MKYIACSFESFPRFRDPFSFRDTSSSSAARLFNDTVLGWKKGIYTLSNALSRRLVKLFSTEHIARYVRSGSQCLFPDAFQHRQGASKQSAQNRSKTMPPLSSRTLKYR